QNVVPKRHKEEAMLNKIITAVRVTKEAERQDAIAVLDDTYREEKHWVQDKELLFPASDLAHESISWFVASVEKQPAGVVRVCYAPPLATYAEYDFQPLQAGLDVDAFVRDNRIAEIGRFAVRRRSRRHITVAAALMRAATEETVRRKYTH